MRLLDQLKAKNLDNPDEMGKFQETHKLPNLVQEEENLNKPIPSNKQLNQLCQTFQQRKIQDQMASLVKPTKSFKN